MRRGSELQGWLTRLRRGGFGVAALFAIALQVFAVQTHVHALGVVHAAPVFAQASHEAVAHAHDGASAEAQRSCLVCQALAGAGRMLAPQGAALAQISGLAAIAAAPDIRSLPAAPAHSWQSRAPPIVL